MQENVCFQMCTHGFLVEASGEMGLMGALYAFSTIEEVADWFLSEYRSAAAIEAGTAETQGGSVHESAVPEADAKDQSA
jgi:hypothetical protein